MLLFARGSSVGAEGSEAREVVPDNIRYGLNCTSFSRKNQMHDVQHAATIGTIKEDLTIREPAQQRLFAVDRILFPDDLWVEELQARRSASPFGSLFECGGGHTSHRDAGKMSERGKESASTTG